MRSRRGLEGSKGNMAKKVIKVVSPVAGIDALMLPATNPIAKELLPVFYLSIIERVLQEVISGGISEMNLAKPSFLRARLES